MDNLPKVIAEDTINLGGYPLKVFILDDRSRILEKESLDGFFRFLADPEAPQLTREEVEKLASFLK